MSESGSPPTKHKRLAAKIDKKKHHNCTCNSTLSLEKNLDNVKEFVDQELKSLKENIGQQINGLQSQLKIVIETLAEEKVIIGRLLSQQTETEALHMKFPVKDERELVRLNNEINSINKRSYIRVISALLNPAGVVKHLKYILSTEVVLEYNVDGVHGKRSLKDLDKFYDVLLESIHNTNLGPAEIQLRKALQLQKKRHFKMVSLNKQVHH